MQYIKNVIMVVQVKWLNSASYDVRTETCVQSRLTNLSDLPSVAPYLFVDPDWRADEARTMLNTLPKDVYGPGIALLE